MYLTINVMKQKSLYFQFRPDLVTFQVQKLRKQPKIGGKSTQNINFDRFVYLIWTLKTTTSAPSGIKSKVTCPKRP